MNTTNGLRDRHLWVLADAAASAGQTASAMLLTAGSERTLGSYQRVKACLPKEEAILGAIVDGLRAAREQRAEQVTVLCPHPELADRLNRRTPTTWDEPVARLWIQARALSHAFLRCEFRTVEKATVSRATRLAQEALGHAPLSRAA